jgi:FAD/FMN-containing dehydrogenase
VEELADTVRQQLAAGRSLQTLGPELDRGHLDGLRADQLDDGRLWCEAGVRAAEAERAVEALDDTLAPIPIPWLRGSLASWLAGPWIPAMEATFGALRSPVLDLRAVLANGEILSTRRAPRSAAGPDPRALLLGRAEELGVLLQAAVRAIPRAEHQDVALAFADPAEAVQAGRRIALRFGHRLQFSAVLAGSDPEGWSRPRRRRSATLLGRLRVWDSGVPGPGDVDPGGAGRPADPGLVERWHSARHGPQARDAFAPGTARARWVCALPWASWPRVSERMAAVQAPLECGWCLDGLRDRGAALIVVLRGRRGLASGSLRAFEADLVAAGARVADRAMSSSWPLVPELASDPMHRVLKRAYDPGGLLNPGGAS